MYAGDGLVGKVLALQTEDLSSTPRAWVIKPGIVAHFCDPSTRKAGTGRPESHWLTT